MWYGLFNDFQKNLIVNEITSEMLFHAKRAARRINRIKNGKNDADNLPYVLNKLNGELNALSFFYVNGFTKEDITKTHRYAERLYKRVENFAYSPVKK